MVKVHNTMVSFTGLPPYYLVSFFQDWISVKEVCWLNSAFCNKVIRKVLLSVFEVKCKLIPQHEMSPVLPVYGMTRSSKLLKTQMKFEFICVRNMTSKEKWDVIYNFHFSGLLNNLTCFCPDATLSDMNNGIVFFCVDREWSYICHQDKNRAITVSAPAAAWMTEYVEATDKTVVINEQTYQRADLVKTYCERMDEGMYCESAEYANGDVYRGEWSKDRAEGEGKMRWANGDSYKGKFHNGKMDGAGGSMWYRGGVERYGGDWKRGERHGSGSMSYENGDTYTGAWVNGLKSGRGKSTYAPNNLGPPAAADRSRWVLCGRNEEVSFEGDFRNDLPNGSGVIAFRNGSRYEGKMKDGLRHGKGVRYEGEWKYTGEWNKGVELSRPKMKKEKIVVEVEVEVDTLEDIDTNNM